MSRVSFQRQRTEEGKQVHLPAVRFAEWNRSGSKMLREDKIIISRITMAARERDWQAAKKAFYECVEPPRNMFNAAMTAAWRCGQYEDGIEIYEIMRTFRIEPDWPAFTIAIKLFARMHMFEDVNKLWQEAITSPLDLNDVQEKLLFHTMMDACGQQGNVSGAFLFLDKLRCRGHELEQQVLGSAMNACKNARNASAANDLLRMMAEMSLESNSIIHTNAMAAHWGRPLIELQNLCSDMSELGLEPSEYFVEQHVSALLATELTTNSLEETQIALSGLHNDRRSAIATVIANSNSRGLRTTSLVKRVAKSLNLYGFAFG